MKQSTKFGSAVLVSITLLTTVARGQEVSVPKELTEKGKLRIGVKCDSPPSGFLNQKGEVIGIDVGIGRYMANAAFSDPDKAAFTCVTAATRVQMLISGKVDVLFATMGVNDERKKMVDFASSTNWGSSGLLVRKGENVKTLEQLKGKRLLTNKGSWQATYLEKNYPDIRLLKYDSVTDAIQALRQGRGDGVAQDHHVLIVAASKDPGVQVADIQFQIGWAAPAVRRCDRAMRRFISQMVETAKQDGTYVALVKEYAQKIELNERIASYTQLPPDGSSDQNTVLPCP